MNTRLRSRTPKHWAAAIVAAGALASTSSWAWALADIHVSADFTTIQEAIDASHDGDQVIVANGIYNEQISFHGRNIIVRSQNRARTTVIDGTDLIGALVTFDDGEGPSAILKGFTIRNGSNNNGAGMRITGASPTIIDVIFHNNHATKDGGAVYFFEGAATFTDCVFVNNIADDDGGAVYMRTANTTAFTRCRSSHNVTYDKGGALYIENSTHLTIHRSIFESNRSDTDHGGAVYITGLASLLVTDSQFKHNSADEDAGAIRAGSVEDLTIVDTMFVGNTANEDAGALRLTSVVTSMIVGCVFRDNQVLAHDEDNSNYGHGDAIEAAGCQDVTIFGSMFQNNYAAFDGGAIYADTVANFTVEHSIFEDNTAEDDGGAIFVTSVNQESVVTAIQFTNIVTDSQFINNATVNHGGAIAMFSADKIHLADMLFFNNVSGLEGGAVFVDRSGHSVYERVDFIGNHANDGDAGALYIVLNSDDIEMSNCRFLDNYSSDQGGAIFIGAPDSNYTANIFECVFENNLADGQGGGVFIASGNHTIEFERSLFVKNQAPNNGGAILSNTDSLVISKSTLSDNTSWTGGAIYARNISASDTSFVNNTAGLYGGAIVVTTGYVGTFNRCNFADNHSQNSSGAIYNPRNVFNSVFDRNSTNGSGGAIGTPGSNDHWLNIRNSTFFGNTATLGNSIWNNSTNTLLYDNIFWGSNEQLTLHANATVDRNTVQNGYLGGTNISSSNPLFLDSSSSNFRLHIDSPAINAGNNTYVSGMDGQDHERAIRISGTVDHGAYEFNSGTVELESNALTPVQWTPNESVQFMWVAAGGPALTYNLTVYGEDGVVLLSNTLDADWVNCPSGTGLCVYRLDDEIIHPNTKITGWAVSARNGPSQEIWQDSESIDPTGETDGPTPFEPVGVFSAGHNLTFTWQADPMAMYYLLSVTDVTGNTITKWYASSEVGCEDGYGLCTATPSKPLKSGVASWEVTALNSIDYNMVDMVTSDSRELRVMPLSVALPIGPNTMTYEFNPVYEWNAVSGATWYLLWVNDETGNVVRQWYSKAHLGCDDEGICTAQPTEKITGAAKWWVQVWNEGDLHGKWSFGETFNAPILTSPELLLPADQDSTIFLPLFMWEPTHGSSWYRVWVNDEDGNNVISTWLPADAVNCENGIGDCRTFIPTTLLEPGNYKWWVQGWNDIQGHGPWSTGWVFTVSDGQDQ